MSGKVTDMTEQWTLEMPIVVTPQQGEPFLAVIDRIDDLDDGTYGIRYAAVAADGDLAYGALNSRFGMMRPATDDDIDAYHLARRDALWADPACERPWVMQFYLHHDHIIWHADMFQMGHPMRQLKTWYEAMSNDQRTDLVLYDLSLNSANKNFALDDLVDYDFWCGIEVALERGDLSFGTTYGKRGSVVLSRGSILAAVVDAINSRDTDDAGYTLVAAQGDSPDAINVEVTDDNGASGWILSIERAF